MPSARRNTKGNNAPPLLGPDSTVGDEASQQVPDILDAMYRSTEQQRALPPAAPPQGSASQGTASQGEGGGGKEEAAQKKDEFAALEEARMEGRVNPQPMMAVGNHISRTNQDEKNGLVMLQNKVMRVLIHLWHGATLFHMSCEDETLVGSLKGENVLNNTIFAGSKNGPAMSMLGVQPAFNYGFFGFGNGHAPIAMGWGKMDGGWRITDETQLATTVKVSCCEDLFVSQTVKLVHDTVSINYSISYTGPWDNEKKPIMQLLPPMHFAGMFGNAVTYIGNRPWTNAELKRTPIPGEGAEILCPERWIAVVDGSGERGVGIFFPYTSTVAIGRHGGATVVAPTRLMSIEAGMKVDFNVVMCIGTVPHIRSVFSILRNSILDSSVTFREVLHPAEQLTSDAVDEEGDPANALRNGDLRFAMQEDGNVVLYRKDEAFWSAETTGMGAGKGPYKLAMQRDGNLVAYGADGEPYWHTDTAGTYGAHLEIYERRDNKMPVAEIRYGRNVKWTSQRLMRAGEELAEGTHIQHRNLYLVMQKDGNVVLYKDEIKDGKATWDSKTSTMKGKGPFVLKMQDDGNLAAYNGSATEPYWSTRTKDNPGAHMYFYEAYDPKKKENVGQIEIRVNREILWNARIIPEPEDTESKIEEEMAKAEAAEKAASKKS